MTVNEGANDVFEFAGVFERYTSNGVGDIRQHAGSLEYILQRYIALWNEYSTHRWGERNIALMTFIKPAGHINAFFKSDDVTRFHPAREPLPDELRLRLIRASELFKTGNGEIRDLIEAFQNVISNHNALFFISDNMHLIAIIRYKYQFVNLDFPSYLEISRHRTALWE